MKFVVNKGFKDSSIGKIPKEWSVVELKDVVVLIKIGPFGSQLKKSELKSEGIKVYTQENVLQKDFSLGNIYISAEKFRQLRSFEVKPGDVLLTIRGTLGKASVVPENIEKGIIHSNLAIIRVDRKKISEYFLEEIINYSNIVINQIKSIQSATTLPALYANIIKSLKIPLPPLEEQRKIVEILSTVELATVKVDEEISKIEQLKKGLMQELLTKGIGHKEFKDSPIGKIPRDWEVRKLGDVITYTKGKKPEKICKDYQDECLPYLSAEHLRENGSTIYVKPSKGDVIVNEGDLLLLWDGSNSGEFFYGKRGILSSTMVKIEQKKPFFNQKFLFYVLKLKEKELKETTKGTGIPHVEKSVLNNMHVQNPSISEQEKIAEILSTVDKLLDLKKKKKEKLIELKKGLMNLLLTGKVRVVE